MLLVMVVQLIYVLAKSLNFNGYGNRFTAAQAQRGDAPFSESFILSDDYKQKSL